MSRIDAFRCVLLGCAAIFAGVAQALDLNQYVTEVVTTNPLVREELHNYRQVAQDYEIALSGWRPSLDLEATAGRFSRKAPDTNQSRDDFNSGEATITLSQNLFRGFDTTHQVEQARALISAAAYRLYDTADNVALDAIRAYLDVLQERELVALAKQNVESHERILAQILERNESGIGLRSEVEQTQGRVARAHASLIAQQNNLRDALSELHQFLGSYVDAGVLIDPKTPPAPQVQLTALIDRALAGHPGIVSAAKNIEAARSDYRRSKSSDYPTLDLALEQSLADNLSGIDGTTDERSLQLTLRYNLFRGGRDSAEQRKRISALYESKAFLDRVRRQVIDALNLAWAGDLALREQIPYLRTHVEKARQTLDTYYEEFDLNLRDLIDLLDAENELNSARIGLVEAHYAALGARYRIYEGIGELLPTVGLTIDLSNDQLTMADMRSGALDRLEPPSDLDADRLDDARDQCDNSFDGGTVDEFGCTRQPEFDLGYPGSGGSPAPADDDLRLSYTATSELVIPPEALLQNDTDPDGDELSVIGYSQPRHGELSMDDDGNLVYVPGASFDGADEFTYTVGDTRARSSVGVVRIQVDTGLGGEAGVIVHFGYKKDGLDAPSQALLEAVAERLLSQPNTRLEVYTYTDNVGSAAYNLRLSERRAEFIKQLFIDRGVEAGRIETHGMGENQPIADNAIEEGRAENRRAELRVVTP